MEPLVCFTGKTRTAFCTRDEADAVQRSRTSVIVSRESTNTGFTQYSCRHGVRSLVRDRTPHDVHRFALSPSFAASAARTTSFRLGRHHLLLRDERTVAMFPTDDCFPTLRRRALAPRSFPYAFHRTEPLTFSRRRWRFGGPSGECAGSSLPLFCTSLRSAASHDDRASDTPVAPFDSRHGAWRAIMCSSKVAETAAAACA
jgi:hypothetical protein